MTTIKLESEAEGLQACRVCLATDTKLLGIHEQRLEEVFAIISGTPVSADDGFPQQLCAACAARLRRAAALRARMRAAHALLAQLRLREHYITTDTIRSVDRSSLRVDDKTLMCVSSPAVDWPVTADPDYTEDGHSNSDYDDKSDVEPLHNTLHNNKNNNAQVKIVETIDTKKNGRNKLKPKIVGTDNIVENGRINFAEVKIVETIDTIENGRNNFAEVKIVETDMAEHKKIPKVEKRRMDGVKKEKRRKNEKRKVIKVAGKPEVEWVARRKPARAGKGFRRYFMCDEDYVKFEEKYNMQVIRLTEEEQAQEMEARRRADSYVNALARCERCGKGFLSAFTYENHLRVHDPAVSGPNECRWCGCRFKWPNNLRTHLIETHELKYVCKQCQRVVRGRHEALLHAEYHAGKTWECAPCGRSFKKKSTFYTHVRMNHASSEPAARASTCAACGLSFKGAPGLKLHQIKKCNKGKPAPAAEPREAPAVARKGFICEVCGKNCTSLSTLAVHLRAHSGDRPHACPGCPLRFAKKDNMEKHHRVVHLGQRPLAVCGVCGKQLAHAASLKLHVNTVHLKLPPPPRAPRHPRPRRRKDTV